MTRTHHPYQPLIALAVTTLLSAGCTTSDEPDDFDQATTSPTTSATASASQTATATKTRTPEDGSEGGIKPGRTVVGTNGGEPTPEELAVLAAYEPLWSDCISNAM